MSKKLNWNINKNIWYVPKTFDYLSKELIWSVSQIYSFVHFISASVIVIILQFTYFCTFTFLFFLILTLPYINEKSVQHCKSFFFQVANKTGIIGVYCTRKYHFVLFTCFIFTWSFYLTCFGKKSQCTVGMSDFSYVACYSYCFYRIFHIFLWQE